MVDTYGRWTYEPNTTDDRECFCDRIANWIVSTGYNIETSIEWLTEMVVWFAEEWFESEEDDKSRTFDEEYVKEYVENSGGLREFDWKDE